MSPYLIPLSLLRPALLQLTHALVQAIGQVLQVIGSTGPVIARNKMHLALNRFGLLSSPFSTSDELFLCPEICHFARVFDGIIGRYNPDENADPVLMECFYRWEEPRSLRFPVLRVAQQDIIMSHAKKPVKLVLPRKPQ